MYIYQRRALQQEMSLYWHRNERSSGHISVAEASADESSVLAGAAYVVVVPGDDSNDELNAHLTRLCIWLSRAGKALFLLISQPSERPSWRSTILRLLPFADFVVFSECNVSDIGTYLYDRSDCHKDELTRDLSLMQKRARARVRVVVCIGRLVSTNCCFCIEGSPVCVVGSVIGSQMIPEPSMSQSREVAFVCGFAAHVAKLEAQIDMLHQTLVLGRSDPQTYLAADSYDAGTMKLRPLSQQVQERREKTLLEMLRWQERQERVSKARDEKYKFFISRNNYSTKPNEVPGSRGAAPVPSSSSSQRRKHRSVERPRGMTIERSEGPSDVSMTYDLRNQASYTARARERDVIIITPAAGVVQSFDTRSLLLSRGSASLAASEAPPGDAGSFFDTDSLFQDSYFADASSLHTDSKLICGSSTLYHRKDFAMAGLTERRAVVAGKKTVTECCLVAQACMLTDT